jgi:hypothetical protein
VDDIVATGASLRDNLANFVADNSGELTDIKVCGVCLVATEEAQRRILRGISKIEHVDVDFRACEILPPSSFAFPDDGSGWNDDDNGAPGLRRTPQRLALTSHGSYAETANRPERTSSTAAF